MATINRGCFSLANIGGIVVDNVKRTADIISHSCSQNYKSSQSLGTGFEEFGHSFEQSPGMHGHLLRHSDTFMSGKGAM